MKKTFILLILLCPLMFLGNAVAEDVPFSIGEWAPYTGKKLTNQGMATEIVTAACKASGLQCVYSFSAWKRCENEVKKGMSFGTFPYKEIPARKDSFLFSSPLFSSSFGILATKSNSKTNGFSYTKPEDLKGFTIGIVVGTDAIKNPLESIGVKVEEVPNAEQNLKKLKAGRIDFYIDDRVVIFQAMEKSFGTEHGSTFAFLENSFGEKNDFKIMVSKEYQGGEQLLSKINEGLKIINDNGELTAILAKYGL